MKHFVVSWSGGKESSLACYKAMAQGFTVSFLLNFIGEKDGRCMSHGLVSKLIRTQAQAIEIPIVQRMVAWNTYECGFKEAIIELKRVGQK